MTSAMPLMPAPPMPMKCTRGKARARSPEARSRRLSMGGLLEHDVGDAIGRLRKGRGARRLRHRQQARAVSREETQTLAQGAFELVVLAEPLAAAALGEVFGVA